jgi:hypothetical protein
MKKKILGLTLTLLLLMVAANGLWAQNTPAGILESPQSASTQGRYRSNADDFIRSDYYTNVKFNTFYAYTSFASTNRASLGFGTKLGSAYLSLYYGGNFWSGTQPWNNVDAFQVGWPGGGRSAPTYTFNFSSNADADAWVPYTNANTTRDNRVALLLGVANMGFRLSYASTHQSFKNNNFALAKTVTTAGVPNLYTTDYYKSFQTDYGVIAPQLEWAMAKDLTEKNGFRPRIAVTLNFNRNYWKHEDYELNGATFGEEIERSNNYVEPHLAIYPNGFHVYNKDGFRLTLDLEYEMRLRMYKNEYSYWEGSVLKTSTIKGLNNGNNLSENSYIDNLLTPSLAGQWSGGNLALRFKLNLPLGFNSAGTTAMDTGLTGSVLVKDGTDSKVSALRFQPNLRLAAQWKALPEKLHLNIGARLDLGNINRTTTTSSTYVNNIVVPLGDTTTVATTYGNTTNALGLGLTFLPTENLAFEANCGISANNSIRAFDAAGLFAFGSILASLKY